ncbi:MAG: hypothetical protein HYW48_02075 [Deltaproteobacteria bacterium]|nr:hypothetical protein [Deltaproteobacteria bacterium]
MIRKIVICSLFFASLTGSAFANNFCESFDWRKAEDAEFIVPSYEELEGYLSFVEGKELITAIDMTAYDRDNLNICRDRHNKALIVSLVGKDREKTDDRVLILHSQFFPGSQMDEVRIEFAETILLIAIPQLTSLESLPVEFRASLAESALFAKYKDHLGERESYGIKNDEWDVEAAAVDEDL